MNERVAVRYIVTAAAGGDAPIVGKAHADDAAYDLRAAEDFYLHPGDRKLVNTGIAVAIPEGFAGLVLPRSGLFHKLGITIGNAPGLIDPGYRGDIGVLLWNTNTPALDMTVDERFKFSAGDRIAQLLIIKTADVELRHSAWLPHSERADAGFGSTGVA